MRKITLGTVYITSKTKEYINQILESRRLTYGPFTDEFEKKFAAVHERKFGIFTNSGTSALQVAIHALKIIHKWNDGDEIIVPSVTFIATINTVTQNNLKPVFVDVDPKNYNIDHTKIEEKITPKTRAIIPVHLMGLSADMDPIMEIAKRNNLKVIEDSCEAMFVKYKGKSVGSMGDIACFSTYAAHLLVTGVGGFALTNNSEYALTMKSLMNHGRDSIYLNIDDDDNITDKNKLFKIIDRRFSFIHPGYSYRLTEFESAVGLVMLEDREKLFRARRENAEYLLKLLAPLSKHIQLPSFPEYNEHAFMMFPIVVNEGINRDELVAFLESRGIETRYLMPLLSQPIIKETFGDIEKDYPVAMNIDRNGFYIGCHQDLSREDIEYTAKTLEEYFSK